MCGCRGRALEGLDEVYESVRARRALVYAFEAQRHFGIWCWQIVAGRTVGEATGGVDL